MPPRKKSPEPPQQAPLPSPSGPECQACRVPTVLIGAAVPRAGKKGPVVGRYRCPVCNKDPHARPARKPTSTRPAGPSQTR